MFFSDFLWLHSFNPPDIPQGDPQGDGGCGGKCKIEPEPNQRNAPERNTDTRQYRSGGVRFSPENANRPFQFVKCGPDRDRRNQQSENHNPQHPFCSFHVIHLYPLGRVPSDPYPILCRTIPEMLQNFSKKWRGCKEITCFPDILITAIGFVISKQKCLGGSLAEL